MVKWYYFTCNYIKKLIDNPANMPADIMEILKERKMTKICAPMVRYSKLQFRTLVRRYDCDICFTPMIMADSFVQSAEARNNDFVINKADDPLIVQFAAKCVEDFVCAAEMIAPYSNGVDLNCGCPQRWAIKDGYGVDLLHRPQDIRKTIEFCRILEKAGASFLTVHARTPQMRNEPIDLNGLKMVRDCVQLPLIANGNVKTLEEAEMLYQESNCEGIMAANGILTNPAMFSGYSTTPMSCVQDWLNITSNIPTPFLCMHHHLVFMLEKILPKAERRIFNNLQDRTSVLEFLDKYYGLRPTICDNSLEPTTCHYNPSLIKKVFNSTHDIKEIQYPDDILGNIFLEQ
ncbi:tRNA-dihydrouridine(20a/20b) synthase [NAD(P)+]-like isoform X2 [Orussus abietinus]|uniref:tRNA-dihydrouridine(20a/20b) synthase [NAD(P)+]-like isoform X2 n=1 Tax=Orussus abietinus TaxID=222816 RepID=UPI0006256316|nr:tRNA-dihydrouridine(20a/20b) synthase [NAD(P)+]-like isoform X2 [Orussus abietinus]